MPAVYSSRKLNLNSQPEAEGNKIHHIVSSHHLSLILCILINYVFIYLPKAKLWLN